jgi:nucleotide-binding universal stress UspA family protein
VATTVLVPLDGSEKDDRALEAALAVSELSGSDIHLLRVFDEAAAREIRATMKRSVAEQASRLAETAARRVTSEVAESFDVARAITERAQDQPIALVVMATRAAGPIGRAVRGSVADRVMRESTRPVFLIPPARSGGRNTPLHRVLVPLDGSDLATTATKALLGFERVRDLEFVLVEVIAGGLIDEPGTSGIDPALLPETARASDASHIRLSVVANQLHDGGAKSAEVRVRQAADAGSAIIHTAREDNVDFIAMSTRGQGGLKRLLLGSVAEGVVRGSDLPVLLFPSVNR